MNTSVSKEVLQGIIPKVALSPEQFEALSKSMESDEPIKALIIKTFNSHRASRSLSGYSQNEL